MFKCFWRRLAFFELTLLFTASHTFLRGIGIHVLDDLLQRRYNAIPVSSPVFKNRFSIAINSSWVFCFCLRVPSTFARGCDARYGGWLPAMLLERVTARKGISAVVTKVDLERVHLRGFTVALVQSSMIGASSRSGIGSLPSGLA